MDDDFNKKEPQDGNGKRSPAAVIISLLVFVVIAVILVIKFNPSLVAKEDFTQSAFEKELNAGNISTAIITPESDKVLFIEGEFKRKDKPGEVDLSAKQSSRYETRVIATDALLNALKSVNVQIQQRDSWWKSLLYNVLPILIIIGLLYFLFSRQIRMAGKGAMQFGKSRARIILPDEHKKTFNDVAGCDEAKEETKEIIDYLRDPLKYKMLGGKIPKGALLTGPPGTGKTLMAKAVAGEASVPFFSISGSDFVEMFVGVGASRVRDMFEQARKHSPCLIFIDEIDAVGRSRFTGIGGGHDEREQTLNALLVEMDGLETQEGVIVLAATNRPDVLDPALLRPGRFDRQIVIDLPDIKGRRKILDVHSKEIKLDAAANLDTIAKSTPGFSGADLANLMNEAALLAAKNERKAATQADLEEARDKVRWGRERKSRKISDKERKITAYHEAGHAIVGLLSENAMPLHKVSIIPRGQAYLGVTMVMPEEDRYTQTKNEFVAQMRVCMGGRVAEEIIFGDITSGASADIAQATRIAKSMVCAYGMSEKMGVVQYGERSEHIYLGRDITKNESYSEETAREIDVEVKRLVEDAKSFVDRLLADNRERLEKLAQELLEKETLDAAEIRKLLDIPEPPKTETAEQTPTEGEKPHSVNITA